MSKYPDGKFDRHPLNVPGPFYVEDGQCVNCRAPNEHSPGLFSFFEAPTELRGYSHCYVKRQPATPEEMDQMLRAIAVSCCSGLRYCGDDPVILEKLQRVGFSSRCDELWDEQEGMANASAGPLPADTQAS